MKYLLATRFDKKIDQGSSTKPWVVFAIERNDEFIQSPQPYVVKLFSKKNVIQQPCIAKEFICNILAKEFDLITPDSGIINLHDKKFAKTLNRTNRNELFSKHQGLTFASKLHDGFIVNPNIMVTEDYEMMARIYSFDCLVLNLDRGGQRNKPNLMICGEDFMLIDHELTFSFIDYNNKDTLDIILDNLNKLNFLHQFKSHLFYKNLINYKGDKENIFNTFIEYLKHININKINKVVEELRSNNISIKESHYLIEYLNAVKKDSEKFRLILIKSIL